MMDLIYIKHERDEHGPFWSVWYLPRRLLTNPVKESFTRYTYHTYTEAKRTYHLLVIDYELYSQRNYGLVNYLVLKNRVVLK